MNQHTPVTEKKDSYYIKSKILNLQIDTMDGSKIIYLIFFTC